MKTDRKLACFMKNESKMQKEPNYHLMDTLMMDTLMMDTFRKQSPNLFDKLIQEQAILKKDNVYYKRLSFENRNSKLVRFDSDDVVKFDNEFQERIDAFS